MSVRFIFGGVWGCFEHVGMSVFLAGDEWRGEEVRGGECRQKPCVVVCLCTVRRCCGGRQEQKGAQLTGGSAIKQEVRPTVRPAKETSKAEITANSR